MLELKRYSCITCGAPLKEQDGKFVCANCKNEFHLEEKISEEEVVALNRATTDRNLLRFDDAFEEYDLLLKKYPKNEMANWGAFLSFYGIVYEQDLDGKYIPTCHRFSEKPVESSKYYYLFNDEHKRRAEEIEKLRVAIAEKAKRIPPYDVFICYKATEERFGRPYPTKESSWARDVYEMLTHELKLRVFFAEKSLGDSNEEYEPHIYSALNSAKLMFVLTTGIENVNAVWVKNEWKRYSKYIQEGQKKTIRVVYDNIEPYDLPLELQKTQAINHNEMDWGTKVKKAAQAIFIDPLEEEKKKREAEEKARKAREEAEARERAREEELQKMREAMEALKKQANAPKPAPAPTPAPVRRGEFADKYCVKCGAGNVSSAKFCAECAHNVFAPEFKQYCLECGAETELLKKFCPNCGRGSGFTYDKVSAQKIAENWERQRRIAEEQVEREAKKRELIRMQTEAAARLAAEKREREAEEKRKREAIARDFDIVDGVLKKYKGVSWTVVVPDYVTKIDNWAFLGRKNVESVTIPSGVKSIGHDAFDGCEKLASIKIPDSVTSIGSGAFRKCTSLKSVKIPKGVKAIESSTFDNCRSLTAVEIPDSVESIGHDAFRVCCNLKSITIPASVTSIGEKAFNNCQTLKSVKIIGGVTEIAKDTFSNCVELETVSLPSGLKTIGSSAFAFCNNLKNITIPQGVTKIGDNAFNTCSSLTSIKIPDGVTSIEIWTFAGCRGLKTVTIGNGVTEIKEGAFDRCESLKDITIPDTVTSIHRDAFSGCKGLASVKCPACVCVALSGEALQTVEITSGDRIPPMSFPNGSNLRRAIIPNGVTQIGFSAFSGCVSLTSVNIPNSVTNIGYNAFGSCRSLTRIIIPESVTSIDGGAFTDCSKLTIYAQAEKKPVGWREKRGFLGIGIVESWNPHKRPVVWGYKEK